MTPTNKQYHLSACLWKDEEYAGGAPDKHLRVANEPETDQETFVEESEQYSPSAGKLTK